jgi:hypothetical protein
MAKEGSFAIEALKGSAGKSTFSLSGRVNSFYSKDWTAIIRGTVDPELNEALTLGRKDLAAMLEPQGKASAAVDITASATRSSVKARINLKDSAFTVPSVMQKTAGTPGNLVISTRYLPAGELEVDSFELQLEQTKINGSLQVKPEREPWLRAQLTAAEVPLVTLNQLPAVKFDSGTGSISTTIWCQQPTAETLQYQGLATIKNATGNVPGLSKAFKNLATTIDFKKQKAIVRDASFMLGKLHAKADAVIDGFSTPRISGKLRTHVLDLQEIIDLFSAPNDNASTATTDMKKTAPDFSSHVQIEADSVLAGNITTGRATATWYASGTAHRFEPVVIQAFDGVLEGKFALGVKDTGVTWEADFKGRDMNLKTISDCLITNDARGKISGLLSGGGIFRESALTGRKMC